MSEVRTERIRSTVQQAYRSTFAAADEVRESGDELPSGWEGLYFPFDAAFDDLRDDGTPARDGVIPDIDLPRRMYAGETTDFLRPLRIGEDVTRTTRLGSVTEKSGSRGRLVFVDVEREYAVAGETAVRSVWHDVFLENADPHAPSRPSPTAPHIRAQAEWTDEVTLDARQLFRFSALTFNTHLIHYDRVWAREVEALPDLLVHGPLTRILLLDAARRHVAGRNALRAEMRAIAPVLVDRPLTLAGRTVGNTTRVTALDSTEAVLATVDVIWAEDGQEMGR